MEWWSFGVMGGKPDRRKGKIFNPGTVSHRRRAQMDTDFKNRLKARTVETLKSGRVAPLELDEIFGGECYKHVAPLALGRGRRTQNKDDEAEYPLTNI